VENIMGKMKEMKVHTPFQEEIKEEIKEEIIL
jgi:hypothetical protein